MNLREYHTLQNSKIQKEKGRRKRRKSKFINNLSRLILMLRLYGIVWRKLLKV